MRTQERVQHHREITAEHRKVMAMKDRVFKLIASGVLHPDLVNDIAYLLAAHETEYQREGYDNGLTKSWKDVYISYTKPRPQ